MNPQETATTTSLKTALEQAAKDINSSDPVAKERATELKRRYDAGLLNDRLVAEGLKPVPIQQKPEEIRQVVQEAQKQQVKTSPERQQWEISRQSKSLADKAWRTIKDVPSDVVETLDRVTDAFTGGLDEARDIVLDDNLTIGQKFLGALVQPTVGAADAFGEAVLGAGKLFVTPEAEERIGEILVEQVTSAVESDPGRYLIPKIQKWYSGLDDDEKFMIDQIGGVAQIVTEVMLTKGALSAAKTAKPVVKQGVRQGMDVLSTGVDVAQEGLARGARTIDELFRDSNEQLSNYVDEYFMEAVRPSTAGQKTVGDAARARETRLEAVRVISDNAENFTFLDANGNPVKGRTPESLQELGEAIEQTKAQLYKQYNALAKQAGEEGITINTADFANELDLLINDTVLQTNAPETVAYAKQMKERLLGNLEEGVIYADEMPPSITPEQAEEAIKLYNQKLQTFYRNPTAQLGREIAVDALIVNNYRKALDNAIEAGNYQDLKRQYGAVRAIETDVVKAIARDAKQNTAGLIDFTDIFSGGQLVSGIVSLNPGLIAQGATQAGIKQYFKWLNDPNQNIRRMFETQAELNNRPDMGPLESSIRNPSIGMSVRAVDDAGNPIDNQRNLIPPGGIKDGKGKPILPEQIVSTEPVMNTKRELTIKDVQGNKHTLAPGEAVQATLLKNGNVHLINGEEFIVNKSQYENLRNNSLIESDPIPFAPELSDTTETYRGATPAFVNKNGVEGDSGQAFSNWSESTVNGRGSDYGMIVVQAPAIQKKVDIEAEINQLRQELTQAEAINERAISEGLSPVEPTEHIKRKISALEEDLLTAPEGDSGGVFTGGHVTAPNQIFHIRGFTDTYKGDPAYFADEFQSDWMIALRREAERAARDELGYEASDLDVRKLANRYLALHKEGKPIKPEITELPEGWTIVEAPRTDTTFGRWELRNQDGDLEYSLDLDVAKNKEEAIQKYIDRMNENSRLTTPWNPELENWIPSAIKRGLLEADARGAEWFVWTNANQQKNRYSQIATAIDNVSWNKLDEVEGGKLIEVKKKDGGTFDIKIDKDGTMLGSSNSTWDKELKGKHISEAFPKEQRNQIMRDETGSVSGDQMKFGGTWADNLYEQRAIKEIEDMTGQKVEYIDMGYSYKKKDSDGYLTDEQLEELSERGIDPDLSETEPVGNLVSYFGEDHYVIDNNQPGGLMLIPESSVRSRADLSSYRSDVWEMEYEDFTYGEEIPYTDWTREINKADEGGNQYFFRPNYYRSGDQVNVYMVKDGRWGSDKNNAGRWGPNNDQEPPKLVNITDVENLDAEYDGFNQKDFEDYIANQLEDAPVQGDMFDEGTTKRELIEDWITQNQFDGDDVFIKERINDGSIDLDEIIEERMDDRGLNTIEGAAADWEERSGETVIAAGDEMFFLESDDRFFAPTDEDAVRLLKEANEARQAGELTEGVMQPALKMTPEVKAIIRGEKLPLKQPTGRSYLLPVIAPMALYPLLTQEQ